MKTFDDFKNEMNQLEDASASPLNIDTMNKMVSERVKKNKNMAMQYFWASFVLQLIVYSMLSHVAVKYWQDPQILILSISGLLLYIPFTIVITVKFKKMAILRMKENNDTSMENYIAHHLMLLKSFFKFKKYYELMLIPISSVIGVMIIFKLYVPGGVEENLQGAFITLVITLVSCYLAIKKENVKNFKIPIENLAQLNAEFN